MAELQVNITAGDRIASSTHGFVGSGPVPRYPNSNSGLYPSYVAHVSRHVFLRWRATM
jgi:hypothetical protein